MNGNPKKRYAEVYTLLFAIVCTAVFFSFLSYGKSFVCRVDGESQYILYLRYMGQYLRKTLSGFFHGNFHPASFDFSIGIGDDIGAIVRFHPLDFLAALFPASAAEQVYAVILLLRFYLAGLSFSAYVFSSCEFAGADGEQAAWQNVLSGSLVYVFCGFMLIRVTNHPTYASAFIVLPLLFLGMEHAASGRERLLFPFAVMLGFWSNYYFMYICSIALLVYALLRYPEIEKQHRGRRFFAYAGKLTGLYLIGLLLSMLTFLPAMLRYRGSFRIRQTSAMQNLFVYSDKRRYAAWFLNLISPYQGSGNGLDLNFAVVVLPALAVLFTRKYRRYRTLRFSLVLELLALLIPVFGYVFAGMNNENNRWVFLISFSLGMCCVHTIDEFADLRGAAGRGVAAVSMLFLCAVCAETALIGRNRYNLAGAAELAGFLALLLLIRIRHVSVRKTRNLILAAVIVSSAVNGFFTYAPAGGNRAAAFRDAGDTTQAYERLSRKTASEIPDTRFYRVDAADVRHGFENSAEYFGYNGIGMYNSILNKQLIRTLLDENNAGLDAVTQVHDLDGRPVSENLAHVKYYLAPDESAGKVPYGYERTGIVPEENRDEEDAVYENQNLLSAGFTCSRFITWDHYESLTDVEKEWVKLDAAVLPEESPLSAQDLRDAGLTEVTGPSADIRREEAAVPTAGDGILPEDGSGILLTVPRHAGTYSYLRLNGLTGASSAENLRIRSDGTETEITLRGTSDVYTLGRNDYLVNLGYQSREGEQTVTLSFGRKGTHRLQSAELLSVSMDGYEQKIDLLNEESLQQEEITDGLLTGTIRVKNPKLAVFSIAWQKGWSLYVDGRKTEPMNLDGMYTGTFLDAGNHEVRLVYHTPGLLEGGACTLIGAAPYLLLALSDRRRRRKDTKAPAIPDRRRRRKNAEVPAFPGGATEEHDTKA